MSTPLDYVLTPAILFDEVDPAAVVSPAADQQRLLIDEADGHLKRKDSSGNVVDVEGVSTGTGLQAISAVPGSPVNGTLYFVDDGGTPATVSVYYRKGGVTYGPFPLFTLP